MSDISKRWPQSLEQVQLRRLLAAPMKIPPCFDWRNRSVRWMGPERQPNLAEEPDSIKKQMIEKSK